MIKVIIKNLKKSIHSIRRMDIFLIITVLILIFSPFLINFIVKLNANIKQVNLTLSSRSADILGGLAETLIDEFNEKNPDLRIRMLYDSSKPNAQIDKNPDIFIFNEGDFNDLIASGSLAEINFYSSSEAVYQYAVPLVSFMDLLFYNIDILSAAGFDRPPKTRDEFLMYAKAVTKDDVSGAAIRLNPADKWALSREIFSWIWAAGGDFWTDENELVFNTRNIASDISFLGNLYRENVFGSDIYDRFPQTEFSEGKIAMMIASSGAIPYLREKMGDTAFGITTIPVPASAGKYNINLSSIYVGINANTAHPEEALRFLVFLVEKSQFLSEEFKAVPGVISDVISCDYINEDPFYSKAQNIYEASGIVRGLSGIPNGEKYIKIIHEELQLFFEAVVTPSPRTAQDTVNTIQRRIEE